MRTRPSARWARTSGGANHVARVDLRPCVRYEGRTPDAAEEAAMHNEAHESCYVANTVRSEIVVHAPDAPVSDHGPESHPD